MLKWFKKAFNKTSKIPKSAYDGGTVTDVLDENGNVIKKVFKIPVGNLTREQAEAQIKKLMSEYRKDVHFDDTSGDIWMPVKE